MDEKTLYNRTKLFKLVAEPGSSGYVEWLLMEDEYLGLIEAPNVLSPRIEELRVKAAQLLPCVFSLLWY